MALLSDSAIGELISCVKVVVDASRRVMRVEGLHRRADIKISSEDGSKQFVIFIRQSIEFSENFSIGLRYVPNDGTDSLILFRCNGPHGPSNGSLSGTHHPHPHVHTATSSNLEEGLRPERGAEITTEFAELWGATSFFLDRVSFPSDQRAKCFPQPIAMTADLFKEESK